MRASVFDLFEAWPADRSIPRMDARDSIGSAPGRESDERAVQDP